MVEARVIIGCRSFLGSGAPENYGIQPTPRHFSDVWVGSHNFWVAHGEVGRHKSRGRLPNSKEWEDALVLVRVRDICLITELKRVGWVPEL